jgi:single-strand DNA-binding protein
MYSLNRAQLIGNLTRDPELKYTPNGQAVTSFSVATNRSWQNQDGTKQDAVEYHDIVAWGKLAEIAAQVLAKGKPAYVEGRLQTRSWEGQDGNRRQKTEIVADNIIALGAKGDKDYSSSNSEEEIPQPSKDTTDKTEKKTSKEETKSEEINVDDIPF